MIKLDDCGKGFNLSNDNGGMVVVVNMVIEAPRGTIALFRPREDPFMRFTYTAQGEAIKLFMEEHQND